MLLELKSNTTEKEVHQLIQRLEWMGFRVSLVNQKEKVFLAILQGGGPLTNFKEFEKLPLVERVVPFEQPYRLAAKQINPSGTEISLKGKVIGGSDVVVMAGPCSIESKEQIEGIASFVAKEGAIILRGGAFKPRTSPYAFQGLGEEGLRYLQEVGEKYDLLTVSEVMDTDQIELIADYVDIIQVGARNMQNYSLLKKLGKISNPVFLKRGFASTYQDLLMAAEYILNGGNPNVILCERGIRTFETYSRNTLDIAAVPILHELTHLPVIVDPSHGTGIRSMVAPMARAAVAAGADGLMIETHTQPDLAVSDAAQTIDPQQFSELMHSLNPIAQAIGRTIGQQGVNCHCRE